MLFRRGVFSYLALVACEQPGPVPEECPQGFANAQPFDQGYIEELAGTYEVRVVPTSHGTTRSVTRTGLLLAVPDTMRRYYPEHFQGTPALLGQRLAGLWRYKGADSSSAVDEVSLDGGIMYVGCRFCLDASPDRFQIEHIAPKGFWGRWDNPQTGLWIIVDSAGRELPKPSGFYCAVRVDSNLGFGHE